MDEEIEKFLFENQVCYDRFTFDKIVRFLLKNDYTHEEAKDTILVFCSLSTLVFQERIYNGFYERINEEEQISEDLSILKSDCTNDHLQKLITDALNNSK